jgi:hypothetical protein
MVLSRRTPPALQEESRLEPMMPQPEPEHEAFPSDSDSNDSKFVEWSEAFMADAKAKAAEETPWAVGRGPWRRRPSNTPPGGQ